MVNEILKDIGGDFPGWLALFLELTRQGKKPVEAAKMATTQRLPNMFGIGRTDEQLFESIRQLVPADKRPLVDIVIGKMEDYEESIFRLTVSGMSCGSELVDKPVKDPAKGAPATTKESVSWEFTAKDLRVKYLGDIADEVSHGVTEKCDKQASAALVVESMRSRRLITRSPSAQKAYELWVDATKWIKENVLELFGVDSLGDITLTKVAKALNVRADQVAGYVNMLADKVQDRPVADMNLGFWRHTFRYYWIQASVLILGIILTIAFFAIVSPN
jgi:hypothetical protein